MDILAIGEEILKALEDVLGNASAIIEDTEWTNTIKLTIGNIGKENYGYNVSATTKDRDFDSEWLYDLTWYKEDSEEYLTEVFLVCESELNSSIDEIYYDFQKLLQSNAPFRLMITQTYSSEKEERIFAEFKEGVRRFEGLSKGEQILWINHNQDDKLTISEFKREWIVKE